MICPPMDTCQPLAEPAQRPPGDLASRPPSSTSPPKPGCPSRRCPTSCAGWRRSRSGTRERVLLAIERLDYKPNTIARQFVQQRTTILGVLLGDLSNPYYAQMAQVVERAAFGFGYTTMFCNIEGADGDGLGWGGRPCSAIASPGSSSWPSFARRSQVNDPLQRGRRADRVLGSERVVGRFRRAPGSRRRASRHRPSPRAGPSSDRLRAHPAGRAQRRPRPLRRLPLGPARRWPAGAPCARLGARF